MRMKFAKTSVLLAVFSSLIFIGCMSAQKLIEKGDDVSAIEKLAKKLTKKSTSQDDADLFVSVYPDAVENRLQNTETVSDVISSFTSSNGASSVSGALKSVAANLSEGSYIGDESSVRSTISNATAAYTRAEDLYRIQKAVRPMPLEIGDMEKGEVYWVEKYNDDFAGDFKKAGTDLAEFIYAVADAGYPGSTITQKQKGYDLYESAKKYNSGMTTECNQKQARLASDIGDLYKASSAISDKRTAIDWYKKANTKVSGYNGVNDKILLTNYEIGELYLAKFESGNSRSDIKDAITYFGNAKSYKDAPIRKAYCESLLDELDNPVEVAEGEELVMAVSFGDISFSDTMTSATIPIKVSGVNYILGTKDFSITKTSAIEKVDVASTRTSATPASTVTYVATVTPVDPDRYSFGTVGIKVLDKSKKVVDSKSYDIDTKKFYVAPEMSISTIEYSKTESDITVSFGVRHLKKKLSVNDLLVSENGTGATLSELKLDSEYGNQQALYKLTFTGVEKSGKITISVIGDDGSLLPCYDSSTLKNTLTYSIDYKKVYVPPVVEAVAKGIMMGVDYYYEGGGDRNFYMTFDSSTQVTIHSEGWIVMSYKIEPENNVIFFDKVLKSSSGRGSEWWLKDMFTGLECYYDAPDSNRFILYNIVDHFDLSDPTDASRRFNSAWSKLGADVTLGYDDWSILPPAPYCFVGNMYYSYDGSMRAVEFIDGEKLRLNDGDRWTTMKYRASKGSNRIEVYNGKKWTPYFFYNRGWDTFELYDMDSTYWGTYNPWMD